MKSVKNWQNILNHIANRMKSVQSLKHSRNLWKWQTLNSMWQNFWWISCGKLLTNKIFEKYCTTIVIFYMSVPIGLGDKGLFLEIRATRSVLGAFIHIKEICFCRIVLLCKFGPTKAKLLFSKYKGFWKTFFFQVPKIVFLSKPCYSIWSHDSEMV